MEDCEMIKLFVGNVRKKREFSEVDASYGEKLHRIAFKILQNHGGCGDGCTDSSW